jgi:SAM-dependent methyltransferase
MKDKILLPGSGKQLEHTLNKLELENPSILVVGSFGAVPALKLKEKFNSRVEIIVEDTDSFLSTNLILPDGDIKASIMSFEITDYEPATFDLVYAQASISGERRNKIVKEIKRILKPSGYFSIGEMVTLQKEVPPFVSNIFASSDLNPLFVDDISSYFTSRNFNIIEEADLTSTLKEYYRSSALKLEDARLQMDENEKKYYKKLLNKISHETNAYLKLGAEKFIGFKYLLLQKGEN